MQRNAHGHQYLWIIARIVCDETASAISIKILDGGSRIQLPVMLACVDTVIFHHFINVSSSECMQTPARCIVVFTASLLVRECAL